MNICNNKRALYDYFIEARYEVGLVLQGWEVKAIRQNKVQLVDSYVKIINGELWLLGCHVSVLTTASTHVVPDALRIKKLLLHKLEIKKLTGKVNQKGFTLIALNLHYHHGFIKAEIALVKGKKEHDKRATIKEREQNREKIKMMKEYRRI